MTPAQVDNVWPHLSSHVEATESDINGGKLIFAVVSHLGEPDEPGGKEVLGVFCAGVILDLAFQSEYFLFRNRLKQLLQHSKRFKPKELNNLSLVNGKFPITIKNQLNGFLNPISIKYVILSL